MAGVDKRAAMLPHIRYEIEHCFGVPKHNQHDPHIRESVHLARLVHARILTVFFNKEQRTKNRNDDDVLCRDFGFEPEKLLVDSKRLNKDICHLTYDRNNRKPFEKQWPVEDVLDALRPTVLEFMKSILSEPPAHADTQELDKWRSLRERIQFYANDAWGVWSGYRFEDTANTSSTVSSVWINPPD